MAYDEQLAERVRRIMNGQENVVEKRMFGGLAFMVQGNMACGVSPKSFLVRVGPERYAEALFDPHTREMDITGRPMKGWVYVDDEGIAEEEDLKRWVKLGVDFALSLPAK